MNKKNKLLCIFFLSSLLFISTINVGRAAPPSWVGVNAGESYTWSINVNVNTALAIVEDLNSTGTLPNVFGTVDPADLFGIQQEVQIKAEILSITDLLVQNDVEYVNVSCSVSLVLPGTTSVEDIAVFGNVIFKYVPNNYTGALFNLGGDGAGSSFGGLFIPTDINWAEVVAEVNAISSYIPFLPSGLTLTAQATGVRGTLTSLTVDIPTIGNVTLAAIQVTVLYNDNGVLSSADVRYGDDVLLSITLTTGEDQEIPSYEVFIVLLTTSAASIGIIYYIKKKKRLG